MSAASIIFSGSSSVEFSYRHPSKICKLQHEWTKSTKKTFADRSVLWFRILGIRTLFYCH